ncbi:MAG: excinuclease ABC subunit UvrA [Polyangiaceae bacterium]|jgi:excinuclease ABC subunit A|nr:excinuclease ABC subunit UvrA [Polyangiaceae bacterium]
MADFLVVKGARQHNLKDVSCRIPRNKLVVITGPSGSGKSSLAFDTIYAEGQRRYVESLSAYARQFLEQLTKPDVELIEGLSPSIAIDQKAIGKSPRSTVGTVTEIADYLRLLYARAGKPHCPGCGLPIQAQTVQQIVDTILGVGEGAKVQLLAPIARRRKGELKLELERLRREGFVRARVDGQLVELGDELVLDRQRPHDLDVMIDRLVLKESVRGRLTDSVELALKHGEGMLLLDRGDGQEPQVLSERFACVVCGVSLPPLEPRLFSFNGPHGACPACGGLGERTVVDPQRCIPEPGRSLRDGAVVSWGRRGSVAFATELTRAVEALGVDPGVPFRDLPPAQQQALLHGAEGRGKKKPYEGVVTRLSRLLEQGALEGEDEESEELGAVGAEDLWRFCVTRVCDACHGKRLRPEALAVKLDGRTIAELGALSLRGLREFLQQLQGSGGFGDGRHRAIAEPLLRSMVARLGFLIDVGLDYLSLDRSTSTLSGGEGQRIRLATQIGAALIGVLYVLDEPSVGLHARDNERLLSALRRLVDVGNSVLVVEHDREAILAADHLIDMGPGAGALGGRIVAQGTPAEVIASPHSVTGPHLAPSRPASAPSRRPPSDRWLRVVNARAHNLQGVTAEIPLGLFVCATGVSGSGKSSLIVDTLLPAVRSVLYGASSLVGACDRVEGMNHVDKVISIDQSPIGRTPRSNPATYTGLFALLREHYASLPEARARGYKAGRFSFNVKGGRCEACQGDGVLRVEMHFLPDVFVTCEACAGKRYGRETLEVQYRGLSIADALELTVDRALQVFDGIPRMRDKLAALRRVGLGYMPLGQPATTLSGGEAQRVKLAKELSRKATGKTLYVLDEPTTGLHFADIDQLMVSLNELCDAGNTVLVIEHNLDVVAQADWVIDLGPEGGERGGRIIAQGTPEEVAATEGSHTGAHLARLLAPRAPRKGKGKKG